MKYPDLDLEKRVVFKIAKSVVEIFEPNDYVIMMQNNVNIYEFIKEKMPELFEQVKTNGKQKKLSSRVVRKLLSNGIMDEFVLYCNETLNEVILQFNGKDWIKEQINYLLEHVFIQS